MFRCSSILALGALCATLTLPPLVPRAAAAERPDAWITFTTKIALLTAGGLDAIHINVDTVQGLVTLHGRVDTKEQRSEAEQLARGTEGVQEVRNLLQVMPDTEATERQKVDDATLKDTLKTMLAKDPGLEESQVQVASVTNGVVLLSGKAATLSDQLRAIERTRDTPGVTHVASEIQGPSQVYDAELWHEGALAAAADRDSGEPSPIRDAWITMATKLKLLANDKTPLGINVDADDGVVTLFGTVSSAEAKAAAETEAAGVAGVKRVRNELQVVPEANRDAVERKDDELAAAITAALAKRTALSGVSVDVKAGVARLTGTVRSQVDRLAAGVTARSTAGVRAVLNDLTVESGT